MEDINRRTLLRKTIGGAAAISLGLNTVSPATPEEKVSRPEKKAKSKASSQKEVGYREAIIKKYPEQMIVAIAKDKTGKANPMTMGWTMITSGRPPMMAVSMGFGRYTTECIKHSRCFTIAFPSAEMAEDVLYFGTHTGRNVDKFAETGSRNEPAKKIDSVLLTDAVANFECELEGEFITGDHIIFAGRIVASHINTAPKRRLYIIGRGRKFGAVQAVK